MGPAFGGRTEERLDDGFRIFAWAHDPSHRSPENQYHRWLEATFPDLYAEAVTRDRDKGDGALTFDNMPTEAHYSRWVGEQTIAFLERGRDPERPFFLWANFYDPHHPFIAPPEYLARYDPATMPRPICHPGALATKPPIQSEITLASYAVHARGYATLSADEMQQIVAAYYAMVTLIDDEVRRILDALARSGLAGETLVVFTSDHGEMLGDHELLLKGPMFYEGAVRVPLLMRWPGVLPAGERRDQLVQWIDLGTTLCAAAGTPPPPHAQGADLL
ncbi:MAG: sulfatase-like hydrolase/transferase, partial [Dehalococcoidia bacterium]